jgi:HTH domain
MAKNRTLATKDSVSKAGRTSGSAGAMHLRSGSAAAKAKGFAVSIAPGVLRTLSARPSTVKSLMETFGKTIESTQRSGRASGFTVMIDAAGNPKFAPLPQRDPPSTPPVVNNHLEAAIQAARERGRLRSAQILDQDDMLTAEEFAERLGVSRMTVNARRQKHELLGLNGAKRGFRFPAWQVDDDGKALDVLPKLFDLLGDSPWGVYRFLTQRHAALEGLSAKDALNRGQTTQVLQVAESLAHGDFA